jgi:hypothetical protein
MIHRPTPTVPFAEVLAPVTWIVGAAIDGLGRVRTGVGDALAEERQIRALTRLDDHLLRDIGLNRDDVTRLSLGRLR